MPFKDTFSWDLIKSIGLPVILFMSGYLLNVCIENRKEKKRLKSVKEYFKTLVKLEYKVAIDQAILYEDCGNRLSNIDERNVSTRKVIGHPEKSLNDISHTDLYKIFIKKNNIDKSARNFNTLLASLDYIDNSINLVTDLTESFELTVNKLDKKWYETGKILTNALGNITGTRDVAKALSSDDPYIREIGKIINYIYSTPDDEQTRTAVYQNVIVSLLKFLNIETYIDDKRNKEFLGTLINIELIFNQYKNLYSRRRDGCLQSAKDLRGSAQEINRLVTEL